ASLLPLHFFSLRLAHPPSSTLFPYTTLFRSCREEQADAGAGRVRHGKDGARVQAHGPRGRRRVLRVRGRRDRFPVVRPQGIRARSEEHTSELQSRENLVCRLLLEKKKKNYRK